MIINNKRALAFISSIDNIIPIEGADNIALASVEGWKVIIKKEEFKVGDKCIYIEIDSLVPKEDSRFSFMNSKKYRVKTLKFNKFNVISQGLVLPLNEFNECINMEIHADVTDLLGVKYYEPEDNARKSNKVDPNAKYNSMCARHKDLAKKKWWRWLIKREWGKKLLFLFFGKKKDKSLSFPTHFPFVHKTDEERVENMPWVLGYENTLIVTEKLDGTSTTFILERKKHNKFEFYVLSRNVRQKTPDQECYHESNIYWEMALKYNIEDKLKEYLMQWPLVDYVCIQGESVGNVQGNPLKLKENDFYVFNFIDSKVGRVNSNWGKVICEKMGLKWVPILDTQYMMPNDMEEFKLVADAKSVVNPDVMREGIVLRDPKTDLSFKNVSREYLLKH